MMILSLGENDTILLQSVDAQRHDSYRVSLMIARTKWFSPLTHKTQIKKKKNDSKPPPTIPVLCEPILLSSPELILSERNHPTKG